MLDKLKLWLNIKDDSQNDLLELLLGTAQEAILTYLNRDIGGWLDCFDNVQLKLAVLYYNTHGAEGVKIQREGEMSIHYEDYEDCLASLNNYRLAKVVGV